MFEEEIKLLANARAARCKPFVSKIDLQTGELEFLRPTEVTNHRKGNIYAAKYAFENGNYYLIRTDWSSHRNSDIDYILYFAFDNKLNEIARINIKNRIPEFLCENDEIKEVLKQAYNKAENGRKVINALIAVAKYHWQKQNDQLNISEIVKQELQNLMQKYNINKQKLLEIVQTL